MNVGKQITRARRARGLNQSQLARLLGRGKSTIHAWENGGPGPRLVDLPELASVLDVTVSDLIGETAKRSKR